MSKDKKRDINIRRFFSWSNIVKGKPIYTRLYELIYFELLKLWIEMGAPPLRAAIYGLINKKDFDDNFIKGKIFQNYINEIKENQCEDNSGFFIYNSEEVLSNKNIIKLKYHSLDIEGVRNPKERQRSSSLGALNVIFR